jgi:ATP-dependent DNA ligase
MEAALATTLPLGEGLWQYEPKWDGFRCLVFRDGDETDLRSKAGQPLGRYFPELLETFAGLGPERFVLDGEILVRTEDGASFDDLLQRIHPAASRVTKLAREHPASFVAFDLLADESGRALLAAPLGERRPRLEAFAKRHFRGVPRLELSPATSDPAEARGWLERGGPTCDGVVAKRLDLGYRAGERDGARKVKRIRTTDCVVGGFRYASAGREGRIVGSLLLGLYGADDRLHHVGFCSAIRRDLRRELTPRLESLGGGPGFTGRAPGGPSRWNRGKSVEWEPLRPDLVVEVGYDHFTGGRFRHGTRFVRWRPDKPPDRCRMEQVTGCS